MITRPATEAVSVLRARTPQRLGALVGLLFPALAVVTMLFGGGLALGMVQSLGHLPAAGMSSLTLDHFARVLADPDFFKSLGLTLYLSLTSTLIAAAISVAAALALNALADRSRAVQLVFQIPLTVPHLVIAVAVVFMLAPSGLLARVLQTTGLISSPTEFPLLVNDSWGVGILAAYVWKEVPFITLMILAVLRAGGAELLDVGRTLKAGRWQRFRYITLPMIFPSLGAASLIVFAYTFGAFEVPYLLGQTYPMMLPVWAYKAYSDVDLLSRPEGIAAGLVIAAVVTAAVALAQGLTQAARRRGALL
jgi:putative spermidine/putrescine transport system permease protein